MGNLMEKDKKVLKHKTTLNKWDTCKKQVFELYKNVKPCKSAGKPFTPEPIKEKNKDTSENAYKRAIFFGDVTEARWKNSGKAISKIRWLDCEVPVEITPKARRHCLDLIGKIGNEYAIAELKNTNGDSPLYAIWETLFYALSAKKNKKYLVPHPGIGTRGQIKKTIKDYWKSYVDCSYLFIGGPVSYWKIWEKYMPRLYEVREELKSKYRDYNVVYVKFQDEDFKKQRRACGGDEYTPKLKKRKLWQEL